MDVKQAKNVRWQFDGLARRFAPLASMLGLILLGSALSPAARAADRVNQKKLDEAIDRGLKWLASRQSERDGHWIAPGGMYPTAITALSATALLCEGSTTTQGKYAANIRRAVDYLVERGKKDKSGLIGDRDDDRYTYGHGFSMLFLSQVWARKRTPTAAKSWSKC